MYSQGVFDQVPWYQCLGNHDIVPGQSGVDFQTKVAPIYDDRWYFVSLESGLERNFIVAEREQGTEGLPYYTYDLVGSNWTATFVVVDSDCYLDSYQKVQLLHLSGPFPLSLTHSSDRTHPYIATHTHRRATTTPRYRPTFSPTHSHSRMRHGRSSNCTTAMPPPQKTTPTLRHLSA